MKTKLTLTIDVDLVPAAKAYARARGVSLSALVEEALRARTSPASASVVDEWAGRFHLRDRSNEPRFRRLVEKYLGPAGSDGGHPSSGHPSSGDG